MKTAVMTDTNSGITKQEADALGIFLMQMPVIKHTTKGLTLPTILFLPH